MKKLLSLPLCAALLLTGVALPGCDGPAATTERTPATPEAQAQAAQDSLMVHHNRLMGRADQLIALAARLQASPKPPRALLARLQAADDAMMSWMHQYSPPDSTAPAPQRLAYLQNQQRQLETVEKQLTSALDSAAVLARQLPADSTGMATPAMQMLMPQSK